MKLVWLAVPLMAANLAAAGAAAVPELPVEYFFRWPTLREVELSPDGRHVAYIASSATNSSLSCVNLETGSRKVLTAGAAYDVCWVNDERLLFRLGGEGLHAMVAVNCDGSAAKVVSPPLHSKYGTSDIRVDVDTLVSTRCGEPDSVLLERAEYFPRGKPRYYYPQLVRVNYFTGKSAVEEKNPGDIVRWLADPAGNVRAAIAIVKDKYRLLFRPERQQPWQTMFEADLNRTADHLIPLGFAPVADELYVATRNGKDTMGIYTFNTATRTVGKRVWQHDQYDVYGPVMCGPDLRLQGVFYESDRPQIEWLDAAAKAAQADVDLTLPETLNAPVSWSRNGKKFIYFCSSDRTPGTYYVVNFSPRGIGAFGHAAAWIKPEQMAAMKPIEYRARDGLTIHGYLTLPVGSPGTNLAMIVVPHGGPWARDSWEFNPDVQFFANRGYAVLQMNFRGSIGYGQEFLQAGFKEWGRKMQDDVTDGVQWAIAQGIADTNRIAIYGVSYGGYAALMGLITTPQLYRCGISYAGVTDVGKAVKDSTVAVPRPFAALQAERIGDYRSEKEELEAVSPMKHADKIRVPVFLAYGGRDPIVDVEQGRKFAQALKKAGKNYELVVEPLEGHGFENETNRVILFRKLEKFLKAHL